MPDPVVLGPTGQTTNLQQDPPKNEPTALEAILDGAPAADPPAEPKPAEGAEPKPEAKPPVPPKEGAPEKYSDFTLPEGIVIEEAALTEATAMFREAGLNQQ